MCECACSFSRFSVFMLSSSVRLHSTYADAIRTALNFGGCAAQTPIHAIDTTDDALPLYSFASLLCFFRTHFHFCTFLLACLGLYNCNIRLWSEAKMGWTVEDAASWMGGMQLYDGTR